jgi:transcriptional regulator with XRE-family HTH domain
MTTPTIPDFPVSYRVRRALDLADVEPKQLAEYIGVHPNTVWNYLNGKRQPKRLVLRAVSDLTGVPLWWLEGGPAPDTDTTPATHGYADFPSVFALAS